jgi:hypothetical protein
MVLCQSCTCPQSQLFWDFVSLVRARGANYSGTLSVLYMPAEPIILILFQSCTCPWSHQFWYSASLVHVQRSQLFWKFVSLVHARGANYSGTLSVLYMPVGANYYQSQLFKLDIITAASANPEGFRVLH